MSRPRPSGFSLAELLMVIAVVALLAGILVPFFQKAIHVQRRVACANNLEKLGQGYATRSTERGALDAGSWQSALQPYVSDNVEVFHCPEDEHPVPAEPMKRVFIEVFVGPVTNPAVHRWDVYLDEIEESRWTWKLSGTQYKEYLAAGSGERVYCPYIATYERTGYVPDGDPDTWYFVFEDQGFRTGSSAGGDKDFYDINLKVHYTRNTVEFTVLFLAGATGYNFNLCVMDPDRKVLIPDFKQTRGTATLPFSRGTTSYGMNSMSPEIMAGRQKLLILDYEEAVAIGSAFDESVYRGEHLRFWDGDPNVPGAPPTFARHFGQVNVLSADGAVKLKYLDEVNPNNVWARRKHWDP